MVRPVAWSDDEGRQRPPYAVPDHGYLVLRGSGTEADPVVFVTQSDDARVHTVTDADGRFERFQVPYEIVPSEAAYKVAAPAPVPHDVDARRRICGPTIRGGVFASGNYGSHDSRDERGAFHPFRLDTSKRPPPLEPSLVPAADLNFDALFAESAPLRKTMSDVKATLFPPTRGATNIRIRWDFVGPNPSTHPIQDQVENLVLDTALDRHGRLRPGSTPPSHVVWGLLVEDDYLSTKVHFMAIFSTRYRDALGAAIAAAHSRHAHAAEWDQWAGHAFESLGKAPFTAGVRGPARVSVFQ